MCGRASIASTTPWAYPGPEEDTTSTTPRLPSAVEGQPAHIGTVRAHAPDVVGAFDDMYAVILGGGILGMDVKEAVRLRNATINDCGL